jgi:DNA-binding NarL/FixJ family response regulator
MPSMTRTMEHHLPAAPTDPRAHPPPRITGPVTTVLVVDDDPDARECLQGLLSIRGYAVECVASAERGLERLMREGLPDVIVLDLLMPGMGGLGFLERVNQARLPVPVIVLSAISPTPTVAEAVRQGASEHLTKPVEADELALTLAKAVERQRLRNQADPLPPIKRARRSLAEAFRRGSETPPDPLTARERQILQLIAEGKRAREISDLLGISIKTAQSHRARIVKKLGITDTAGLVRYAIRRGLSSM